MKRPKDILKEVEKSYEKYKKVANKVNKIKSEIEKEEYGYEEPHTCGIVDKNEVNNSKKQKAIDNIKRKSVHRSLVDKILSQKDKGSELVNAISSIAEEVKSVGNGGIGDERGNEQSAIDIVEYTIPVWVRKLLKKIKSIIKQGYVKDTDYYETSITGVPTKHTTEGVKKKTFLYTILDTSGSMTSVEDLSNRTLLSKLTSFIFSIVNKNYKGKLIMIDTVIQSILDYKDIKKHIKGKDLSSLKGVINAVGLGGTDMKEAFDYVIQDYYSKSKDIKGLIVILASDFQLPREDYQYIKELIGKDDDKDNDKAVILPENFILLTSESKKDWIPEFLSNNVIFVD